MLQFSLIEKPNALEIRHGILKYTKIIEIDWLYNTEYSF